MANFNDPAEKALVRLEVRRFISRCENNEGLVQRADSLRELARLGGVTIPYKITNEVEARNAQRTLLLQVEDRAKELLLEQIAACMKSPDEQRAGLKNKMVEDWANLTGGLSHLRSWAKSKLNQAEQAV